jgi:hypothetical protein
MAQVVSRGPFTAETWVWSRYIPREYFGFPLFLSFQQSSTIVFNFKATLKQGETDKALKPPNKWHSFGNLGASRKKTTFTALVLKVLSIIFAKFIYRCACRNFIYREPSVDVESNVQRKVGGGDSGLSRVLLRKLCSWLSTLKWYALHFCKINDKWPWYLRSSGILRGVVW